MKKIKWWIIGCLVLGIVAWIVTGDIKAVLSGPLLLLGKLFGGKDKTTQKLKKSKKKEEENVKDINRNKSFSNRIRDRNRRRGIGDS